MDFISDGESGFSVRQKLNSLLGMAGTGGSLAGEIDQLKNELIAQTEALDSWMDSADVEIAELQSAIDEDRNAVQVRLSELRDDLTTSKNLLTEDIEAALNISREYVDTSIYTESNTRQTEIDALAAQVSQLTATLVSEDLISNGDFADGMSFWTAQGTTSVIVKDEGSSNPIVATMPAEAAARISIASSLAQTTATFEISDQDRFQVRISAAASGTAARSVELRSRWFAANGSEITPAAVYPMTLQANSVWRVLAARIDPPDNARSALVEIANTSASGQAINVTNIQATVVNGAIEARVSDIEAAYVTLDAAMTLQKSESTARFEENEATVQTEITNRTTADAAISERVDSLVASNATNEASISTLQTAFADADESIAALETEVSANYGSAERVRDGSFDRDLVWWTGNLNNHGVFPKNPEGTLWAHAQAPTTKFLRINTGATGTLSTDRFPVAPGETYDVSFSYARSSTGVIPRIQYRFRRADGSFTNAINGNNGQFIVGTKSGAWESALHDSIVAPPDARTGEVSISLEDNTLANSCWITEVSMRRRQPYDALAAAEIASLKYAVTDPDGALAILEDRVTANFSDLDTRTKTNASAIDQRYTKAQADSAISAAINTYSATVTNQLGQKANASTVTTLSNLVNDIDGELAATSDLIQQVKARTDRGTASGLFRVSAHASPTGIQSRIGIRAEVNANDVSHSAALYLEAKSDGTSQVAIAADRFYLVSGIGTTAARFVPFLVEGNVVYIDTAFIKDLTVTRLKIANGSITSWIHALRKKARKSSRSTDVELCKITFAKPRAVPMPIFFAAKYPQGAQLMLQRRVGTGAWTTLHTITDRDFKINSSGRSSINSRSGEDHTFVDKWTGVGRVSYRLMARSFTTENRNFGGGGSEASWIDTVVRADHNFRDSFIGTFTLHK